jgi:hypothetical protein
METEVADVRREMGASLLSIHRALEELDADFEAEALRAMVLSLHSRIVKVVDATRSVLEYGIRLLHLGAPPEIRAPLLSDFLEMRNELLDSVSARASFVMRHRDAAQLRSADIDQLVTDAALVCNDAWWWFTRDPSEPVDAATLTRAALNVTTLGRASADVHAYVLSHDLAVDLVETVAVAERRFLYMRNVRLDVVHDAEEPGDWLRIAVDIPARRVLERYNAFIDELVTRVPPDKTSKLRLQYRLV